MFIMVWLFIAFVVLGIKATKEIIKSKKEYEKFKEDIEKKKVNWTFVREDTEA